jgi:hypothetical protein
MEKLKDEVLACSMKKLINSENPSVILFNLLVAVPVYRKPPVIL